MDAAHVKAVGSAIEFQHCASVPPVQGIIQRLAQSIAPVNLKEAAAHAGFLRSEDFHSCGVDGADVRLLVQLHQTLLHMGGNLNEFIGLALKLAHLGIDL